MGVGDIKHNSVLFGLETRDMVEDKVNDGAIIKLGVKPDTFLVCLAMLGENLNYVGRIHCLYVHFQPQELTNCQFHYIILVMDIIGSSKPIKVRFVDGLKAYSESSCFKSLFY